MTSIKQIEAEIQISIKEEDSKAQISTDIWRNRLKISIDVKIEWEIFENIQINVIKPVVRSKKGKFNRFEKKLPNIIITFVRPFSIQSIVNKRPKKVWKADFPILKKLITITDVWTNEVWNSAQMIEI